MICGFCNYDNTSNRCYFKAFAPYSQYVELIYKTEIEYVKTVAHISTIYNLNTITKI